MRRAGASRQGTDVKRRRRGGFGLITAIFLLVVLGGLGAAIASLFVSGQQSASLDIQGERAYQAARAGLEWGLFVQLQPPAAACFATTSFKMPASSVLAAFTVTVVCTQAPAVAGIVRRQLKATACNQPSGGGSCPNPNVSADYVQRVVQAEY